MGDVTLRLVVNGDQLTVLDQAGNKLQSMGNAAQQAGGAGGLGAMTKGAADMVQGIQGSLGIMQQAATMFGDVQKGGEAVQHAFQALDQMSHGNTPAYMKAMQESTHGLVTETDLAHAAALGLSTGIASNAAEMAKIAGIGASVGEVFMNDATQGVTMFESALEHVGQTRPLATLGFDITAVKERFNELTKQGMDKADAWKQTLLELAPTFADTGNAWDKMTVKMGDAIDTLKGRAATGFNAIASMIDGLNSKKITIDMVVKSTNAELAGSRDPSLIALSRLLGLAGDVGDRAAATDAMGTATSGPRSGGPGRGGSAHEIATQDAANAPVRTTNELAAGWQKVSDIIAGVKYDMLINSMDASLKKQADQNDLLRQEGAQRAANADTLRSEINLVSGSTDYRALLYGGASDPGRAQQRQGMRDIMAAGQMSGPSDGNFGGRYSPATGPGTDVLGMQQAVKGMQDYGQAAKEADGYTQNLWHSMEKVNNKSLADTFHTGSGDIMGEIGGGLSQDAAAERANMVKHGASKGQLAAFDAQSKDAIDQYKIASGQATPESIKFNDALNRVNAAASAGKIPMAEAAKEMKALADAAAQGKAGMQFMDSMTIGGVANAGGGTIPDRFADRGTGDGKPAAVGAKGAANPFQPLLDSMNGVGDRTTALKGEIGGISVATLAVATQSPAHMDRVADSFKPVQTQAATTVKAIQAVLDKVKEGGNLSVTITTTSSGPGRS